MSGHPTHPDWGLNVSDPAQININGHTFDKVEVSRPASLHRSAVLMHRDAICRVDPNDLAEVGELYKSGRETVHFVITYGPSDPNAYAEQEKIAMTFSNRGKQD